MSSAAEMSKRIRLASHKLREDMERILPREEQASRIDRLIEIAGQPTKAEPRSSGRRALSEKDA